MRSPCPSRHVMSRNGSPSTTSISANAPGAIRPSLSGNPGTSAAVVVALLSGVALPSTSARMRNSSLCRRCDERRRGCRARSCARPSVRRAQLPLPCMRAPSQKCAAHALHRLRDHGGAAFGRRAAAGRESGRPCADHGDVCTNGAHDNLSGRGPGARVAAYFTAGKSSVVSFTRFTRLVNVIDAMARLISMI